MDTEIAVTGDPVGKVCVTEFVERSITWIQLSWPVTIIDGVEKKQLTGFPKSNERDSWPVFALNILTVPSVDDDIASPISIYK